MATTHLTDEQLSGHIDGALADDAVVTIAHHLHGCDACAARLQMLRATSQAVASLPDEELSRPIDFGFLREVKSSAVPATTRGFVARVIHGTAPTWVPTAVAAAAVLALSLTWAPRLLPSTSNQATATAGLGPATRSTAPVAPQANGAQAQDKAPGGPQVGGTPGAGTPGINAAPQASQKTVTSPDGSTVTILANPAKSTTGHPTQLLLRLVGGPHGTSLAAPGMEIFIGDRQSQVREAGSEGTSGTLKAGEELDLTVQWTAGALAGPPAPGNYSVIGRVFLADGKLVEVTLSLTVSS